MTTRLELNDKDREIIKEWAGGMGWLANFASNIKKQGYITEKQRYYLHLRAEQVNQPRRSSHRHPVDYNEEDYEMGAYELCVDWAK